MAKVKEVSSYSGSAWGTAVPIGANATNIDMASNPSDYDSSSTETSTAIINTNDVKVISSDTDLTAWGKFNRFRKRVSNAFGTLSGKTLATAYITASADSKIYSASVLNSYMTNVIGYSGTTAPSEGTVASQLSSLNSKTYPEMKRIGYYDDLSIGEYTTEESMENYSLLMFMITGYANFSTSIIPLRHLKDMNATSASVGTKYWIPSVNPSNYALAISYKNATTLRVVELHDTRALWVIGVKAGTYDARV